jgi:hypothetical protein
MLIESQREIEALQATGEPSGSYFAPLVGGDILESTVISQQVRSLYRQSKVIDCEMIRLQDVGNGSIRVSIRIPAPSVIFLFSLGLRICHLIFSRTMSGKISRLQLCWKALGSAWEYSEGAAA